MSEDVVEILKKNCENLISSGARISRSVSLLLHGNLRSTPHMISQIDEALMEWESISLRIKMELMNLNQPQKESVDEEYK